MAKTAHEQFKPSVQLDKDFYLAEWMRALGVRAAKIAAITGFNEGYISELVNGEKTNPGAKIRHGLAMALDIPARFLFEPPPTGEALLDIDKYGAHLLQRLAKIRKRN